MSKTVLEIIRKYIIKNKYDGLYNSFLECACLLDDLAPCRQIQDDCKVGYKQPCDCGNHDFHIGAKKNEVINKKAEKWL